VEILGNFQQSVTEAGPGHGDGLMEKLAGAKNLRTIIERIVEQLSLETQPNGSEPPTAELNLDEPPTKSTGSPAPSESGHDLQALNRIQRFTLRAVEAPLRKAPRDLAKGRVILLTEDELGVARLVAGELQAQGQRTAIVRTVDVVRVVDEGIYEADLSSPQKVARLLEVIRKTQGPLGGIIHLLPLRTGVKPTGMELAGWRERLRAETKSLFYLAKTASEDLIQSARVGGACIIAVTGMGGAFFTDPSVDAEDCFAGQGAVAGLIKTLAQEWPELRVKAVDLNPAESPQALASHLLDECTEGDEQVEVGYDGRRRLVLEPRPAPLDQQRPSDLELDASSVLLITGGARGITAQVARQLAERYHPTLLLVGRSPLPDQEEPAETTRLTSPKELKAALIEQLRRQSRSVTPARVEEAYAHLRAQREIRGNLDTLRRLGSKVYYHSVDVRDGEAFGSLIDQIYRTFGRLDGVVHGAGVIEDKLVQDKTLESFDRVFDTKADSAFLLSQRLRPEKLQFLVFFSSVTGRFGNRGQGDYAAANEVLNKLAVQLDRQWPGRVVSINWGPWDSDGMVSPEVRKQFAERGVELIPAPVGVRRLEEELRHGRKGEAEIVIGGIARQPAASPSEGYLTTQQSLPLILLTQVSRANGSVELIRKLEPGYDRYLDDHRLNGRPVFPLAMATELMAEVVAQGWPDLQVARVRDLFVLQGIVLQDESKTVRVVGSSVATATEDQLSIAVEIVGTDQPQRVHYRAIVDLVRCLPDPAAFSSQLPTGGRTLSMDISEVYRQWLFHGPLFQGIRQVNYIGREGMTAILAPSSPVGWVSDATESSWLIDPLMLDSGLQLLILWSRQHWEMTTLPSCFRAYHRFDSQPGNQIHCEVRIRPNTGGHTIHADLVFINADGRVIGVLEDIEGSSTRALNRVVDKDSVPFFNG
jgi:NAD(P)-dependent dehydrogenase (short-subunit alcohol dehydrogenase family)